eukprot:SAG31_NODE_12180_length_961_cov_0.849188_1_plen_144_part_00
MSPAQAFSHHTALQFQFTVRAADFSDRPLLILTEEASIYGLGGAQPEAYLVFMAVSQMEKVYGKAKSQQMLGTASAAFNEVMVSQFEAERAYGAVAVKKVFDRMAAGHTDAKVTYVCSMWTEAEHEPIAQTTPPTVARAEAKL